VSGVTRVTDVADPASLASPRRASAPALREATPEALAAARPCLLPPGIGIAGGIRLLGDGDPLSG